MGYIEIKELTLIGESEAGSTFGFETLARAGFIFAQRKEGTISGNHYHKGLSKSKNPEILLLTAGEAEIDGHLNNGEEVFRQIVKAPVIIKIYPKVIHRIRAITSIQFLEFNSIEEHKADTFYHEVE